MNGNDFISFVDPSSEVLLPTAAALPHGFAGGGPAVVRPWRVAASCTAKTETARRAPVSLSE